MASNLTHTSEKQSLAISMTSVQSCQLHTQPNGFVVSGVGQVEEDFHKKFDEIFTFVETSEMGPNGIALLEMLEKFRNQINLLCAFNNEYAGYSRNLDAIKNKTLEKFQGSEDEPFIYYNIIQKSLEYLASELKFDYVGIWKDISDEAHPNAMTSIHQIGNPSLINEAALFDQIKSAEGVCTGKEFIYNCPSDSALGLVDIIYIFKNSFNQPVGYLVVDDTSQKRTLNESEKIAITTYFYNELKNMIKEHELSLSINSIRQLQIRNAQLEEISEHDAMTGLYNRKALLKVFNVRLEDFNRLHIPLCAVMIDIDHFKKINDTYGHTIGDEVIKFLGSILNGMQREIFAPRGNDYFFRMGGEEFLGVLSNVSREQAEGVCERIRQALEKHVFTTPEGINFSITASFGITQIVTRDVPKEYLKAEAHEIKIPDYATKIITRADKALYVAKNSGRNCIKFYTSES